MPCFGTMAVPCIKNHDKMIQIDDSFWNIRSSFRIAGLIDIGTQCSLFRRQGGGFVLLDCVAFDDATADAVAELTFGGAAIEAILNLHPFHTVHVEKVHRYFPEAILVGTTRHKAQLPELPWEELTIDQPEAQAYFEDDLDFSIPRGVDFISANEKVHFGSVLAYHRRSRTIHVDDTFNYVPANGLLKLAPFAGDISVHPTLDKALQPRADAAADFRAWGAELVDAWSEAEHLCAAHTSPLLGPDNDGDPIAVRMRRALEKVESVLKKHESAHA